MEPRFAELFSRQPNEVVDSDYFYHLPDHEKWKAEIRQIVGAAELEDVQEQQKNRMRSTFLYHWLQGAANPFLCEPSLKNEENADVSFERAMKLIARDGKPFMDIASWEDMGLAPYVLKMNPAIPCLLTDIDAYTMKQLRSCIRENLVGYHINIASFDNFDIPLKNQTLHYITSWNGIGNSCNVSAAGQGQNLYQFSNGKEKVIDELYRILKPGGRLISLERNRECDYDLPKLRHTCEERGSLLGYTFDEIRAVCNLLIEEPWHDKFTAAGFQVEVEQKQCRSSLHGLMTFFYHFTTYHGIRQWENQSEARRLGSEWIAAHSKTDDMGIDLYETNTFYVLRKP